MKKHKENRSGSEKDFLFHSESGTATVIGAVMLLGIIFSVLTFTWVECVPEWKNDAEYSHMDNVWEDMGDLKSRIDMMSIVMASNSNSSNDISSLYPNSTAPSLVTSVPFHMGGGGIPFVSSMKSSGTLSVNKGKCVISITVDRAGVDPYINSIDCGTVTYTSQNSNYVDQVFSYESGALILDQGEQSVMMLYPSISFSNVSTSGHNEYNISINTVSVCQNPHAPPEIISSNSEGFLHLTGSNYIFDYISFNSSEKQSSNGNGNKKSSEGVNKFTLIITSNYPDVWMQYLNKTIEDAGIGSEKYKVQRTTGNNVRLTFYMPYKGNKVDPDVLRLYVSQTSVKAEPGVGLK